MYTNVVNISGKIFYSYIENDKRIDRYEEFVPSLYVPDNDGKYKGEDGKTLKKVSVPLKRWKELTDSKKNFFYGEISPIYQFIASKWKEEINPVKIFKHLTIYAIDIEVLTFSNIFPNVSKAEFEISSVSIKDFTKNMMYVISFLDYDKNKSILGIDKERIVYKKCRTELELLKTIVYILEKAKPDLLTGWNIEFFDLPYLYNRISSLLGDEYLKRCSPFKIIKQVNKKNYNDIIVFKDILIPYLDYLALYKRYINPNGKGLTLNNICLEELDLEKLKYEGELIELAGKNPQLYVDYNIWDSELVYLLDQKLKLIELAINIMYRTKTLHNDVMHATKLWDVLIYNELKKIDKVILPYPIIDDFSKIKGAFVFPPLKGLHENIVVFDVNSLYPNIVIGANISKMLLKEDIPGDFSQYKNPIEKNIDNVINGEYKDLLNDLQKCDCCYTPNSCFWKRGERSLLSRLMEEIYDERINVQKRLKNSKSESNKSSLNIYQNALKLLLNSGYGVFASPYFRYKDNRVGEAITSTGQLIIKTVHDELSKKMQNDVYMIGGDTDSIFISLTPFVKRMNLVSEKEKIEKIIEFSENQIVKLLNSCFEKVSKQLNFYKQPLKMKLEYIADRGLYPAKKNYIVQKVTNGNEILKEKKIVAKGVELIRSSMPFFMRKKLKQYLVLIMNGKIDELKIELGKLREDFEKLDLEHISFVKTTTDIIKYSCSYKGKIYDKKTPIHIRAAILYNHLVDKFKLNITKAYDNGKINYVYMKLPNILDENVLGFVNSIIFDKLKLRECIDYDTQFEKLILSPLNKLTEFYEVDLINDKSDQLESIDHLWDYLKKETNIDIGSLINGMFS